MTAISSSRRSGSTSKTTQTSVNAPRSSVTTQVSHTGTSRPCHSSHATASSSATNMTAADVNASMLAVIAVTPVAPQRRQRLAFVEDVHILSFPPQVKGQIEKPSRNGMALKTSVKSMPVRAVIEYDDEREEQQAYAACDG